VAGHHRLIRVDLLFDFPIPAAKLAKHATRIEVRTQVFDIASDQDLLRLKRIAKRRVRHRGTPRTARRKSSTHASGEARLSGGGLSV
jgi:hypothetical protein